MEQLAVFLPLLVILLVIVSCFKAILWLNPALIHSKLALMLASFTVFMLLWVSLAVGIFADPDIVELFAIPAAVMVAVSYRFSIKGVKYALFVAASMQVIIAIFAVTSGQVSPTHWLKELCFNGVFVLLFILSALLIKPEDIKKAT